MTLLRITPDVLMGVELADRDATTRRQARDNCLELDEDSDSFVWCCCRHKGHSGHHVDPSMPPKRVRVNWSFHRWLTC